MVGSRITHYEIIEKLGSGGMGVVYKARDVRLNRSVALKFLPLPLCSDPVAAERFKQEAQAASALDHPNVCTIYEIDEAADGQLFVSMAYYRGQSLREGLAGGSISVERAEEIVRQVATGLAEAHRAGIVHRDIKPANLMCLDDGSVKIVDFGLAKLATTDGLTRTGTTVGTVAYMSPEQTRGDAVDRRTDIWSLGVVLYEMLAGRDPFHGDYDTATSYAIINEEPKPLGQIRPDTPARLEYVVERCMAKQREDRFESMDELVKSMDAPPGQSAFASRRGRVLSSVLRRPSRIAFAVLGVLAMFVVGVQIRNMLRPPVPSVPYVAVLPFVTVGGDADDRVFADGLVHVVARELTGLQSKVASLWVAPATDVVRRGITTSREAARQLHVNLVITGAALFFDGRVRLTLELADAKTGQQIRSEIVDEEIEDGQAIQASLVEKLTSMFDVELDGSDEVALVGESTAPGAYQFYVRGHGYLRRFDDESNIDFAADLFRRAIAVDSQYALAHAGLGEAYWRKYQTTHDTVWVGRAVSSVRTAVRLDPGLSDVNVALGRIYLGTGKYEEAEDALEQAISSDAGNAEAHRAMAKVYEQQGRTDEAEGAFIRAIRIAPDRWSYHNDLGIFYHGEARHEDASVQFRRVTELAPDNAWGWNNLAAQYHNMGDLEQAVPLYERAAKANPDATSAIAVALGNMAAIYYARDSFRESVATSHQSLEINEKNTETWDRLGNSYYWLGIEDSAHFAWRRVLELGSEQLTVNSRDTGVLETIAFAHAKLGEQREAEDVLARRLAMEPLDAESMMQIAKIYERIGNRAVALQYVERAMPAGFPLSRLEASQWLDALREDPGFERFRDKYPSTKDDH